MATSDMRGGLESAGVPRGMAISNVVQAIASAAIKAVLLESPR